MPPGRTPAAPVTFEPKPRQPPTRKPGEPLAPPVPPPPEPPPGFKLMTAPAGVAFARRGVQPPGQYYITTDDKLLVLVFSSVVGQFINLTARVLTPTGKIVIHSFPVPETPPYGVGLYLCELTEGYLLDVKATCGTAFITRGQVWITISLRRGNLTGGATSAYLVQDYINARHAAAWPPGEHHWTVEGAGALRTIVGTDPAAGSEVSETIPTGARWRVIAIRTVLTTSAAPGNRTVRLRIDDGTNIFAIIEAGTVQAPSTTIGYTFATSGASQPTLTSQQLVALPNPCLMTFGYRFSTLTGGRDVADDYEAPIYLVEEWLDIIN
jgi:hypothetical protein